MPHLLSQRPAGRAFIKAVDCLGDCTKMVDAGDRAAAIRRVAQTYTDILATLRARKGLEGLPDAPAEGIAELVALELVGKIGAAAPEFEAGDVGAGTYIFGGGTYLDTASVAAFDRWIIGITSGLIGLVAGLWGRTAGMEGAGAGAGGGASFERE